MKSIITRILQISLCTFSYFCIPTKLSQAQVTPDGTVNTQVNQNGSTATVTGGETRGNNLFHSFQDFSVSTGNEAFFNNADSISNIFSRVTGGNISNIDGVIRANGSASLFIINPAGIVFGENARLDIGGSFLASTASSILFEGGEFSAADLDNPPVLTVNAPIGLGFRDNPGDITYRAATDRFLVAPGNNISLIGGNINLDGGIVFTQGGRIELGGLTEAGAIDITENGRLSFPEVVAKGNITLDNNSRVVISTIGGSAVDINAMNLAVNSGSLILLSTPENGGVTNDLVGDITLNLAEDLTINGAGRTDTTFVAILNSGNVNSGNIEVNARNIELFNGGQISNFNPGNGEPGNINLNARGDVSFNGLFSGISNSGGDGTENVGNFNLTAQNFNLTNGAVISSITGDGNSGDINLNIADTILIDGVGEGFERSGRSNIVSGVSGDGNTGDIKINARNLILSNEGTIVNSNRGRGNVGNLEIDVDSLTITEAATIRGDVFGTGNGGNITINATDAISIVGNADVFSFIRANVSEGATGEAGNITIDTPQLLVDDAFISADVLGNGIGGEIDIQTSQLTVTNNSFISANVSGNGIGGEIDIQTSQLTVTNNSFISADVFPEADGASGEIDILASDFILLSNQGLITANTSPESTGNAGNLTIVTGNLTVDGIEATSQISATTNGSGDAGNVNITADSIDLRGVDEVNNFRSGLLAKATVGSGNGGNLTIVTGELNISDGAAVEAGNLFSFEDVDTPIGTGEAGNIDITADSINLSSGGRIDTGTQSARGNGANIVLDVAEDITLRDSGLISAEAIEDGNGGNLDINSRFIIAFPQGNNDILASAERGSGGNININVESLFGIEERPKTDTTNDLDASSEFSLDGEVTITRPDLNPAENTVELSQTTVAPEETTAQACRANRANAAKNGLNITGRGGVSPAPELPLGSENIVISGKTDSIFTTPEPITTSQGKIQPARGIKVTPSGNIVLTAYRTNNSAERIASKRRC